MGTNQQDGQSGGFAVAAGSPPLKYATEQRLRFVDFLLAEYGHVSRRALTDYYDVSDATATRDLAIYREIAPRNVVLNPTDHRYYKTAEFVRVWK